MQKNESHASGEGGDPGSYTVLKAGIVLLALPPFTKHLDIALEGAVKLFPLHGVLRSRQPGIIVMIADATIEEAALRPRALHAGCALSSDERRVGKECVRPVRSRW